MSAASIERTAFFDWQFPAVVFVIALLLTMPPILVGAVELKQRRDHQNRCSAAGGVLLKAASGNRLCVRAQPLELAR